MERVKPVECALFGSLERNFVRMIHQCIVPMVRETGSQTCEHFIGPPVAISQFAQDVTHSCPRAVACLKAPRYEDAIQE